MLAVIAGYRRKLVQNPTPLDDKSANVVGADLDRRTNKAAVAAIAMASLTDGGSRFNHDHSPLGP
jgi:hypothetical protein